MNGLVIVLIGIVALGAGYLLYGRWLAKKWGLDPKAKTPAYTKEDGQDYVPSSKFTVFSHQFSSIAGAVCHGAYPRFRIRLGTGSSVADCRRFVLRCRTGLWCSLRIG